MTSSWSLTRVLIATTRAHDSHQFAPHRRHYPNGWRVLPFGVPVNANGARWCSGSCCAPFFFRRLSKTKTQPFTRTGRWLPVGVYSVGGSVPYRSRTQQAAYYEHDQTKALPLSPLRGKIRDRADGIPFRDVEHKIVCLGCDETLSGREGAFVLKYFLVSGRRRTRAVGVAVTGVSQ